jgi:hypothetical protein
MGFFFYLQIIREVDVALERSLRAELVDLIESEGDQDSELELDENNDLHKSTYLGQLKQTTVEGFGFSKCMS